MSPSIGKRYLTNQNTIMVKKWISCSHIESPKIRNEEFAEIIPAKSLKNVSTVQEAEEKQPFPDILQNKCS